MPCGMMQNEYHQMIAIVNLVKSQYWAIQCPSLDLITSYKRNKNSTLKLQTTKWKKITPLYMKLVHRKVFYCNKSSILVSLK